VDLSEQSPAHRVAPLEPDDVELAALAHVASEAEQRIADRESEEAAHQAFDAELGLMQHGSELGEALERQQRSSAHRH
jgi:hypothetical protein